MSKLCLFCDICSIPHNASFENPYIYFFVKALCRLYVDNHPIECKKCSYSVVRGEKGWGDFMFHYSLVKLVRCYSNKLDKPLRDKIIKLYKPLRFTPRFAHSSIDQKIWHHQKLSVIIEFEKSILTSQTIVMDHLLSAHSKCSVRNRFSSIFCYSADVTPDRLHELLSVLPSIKKVYLNRKIVALPKSNVYTKSSVSFKHLPQHVTGQGVTIAIVDTGVSKHDDLKGRISGFVDFISHRTQAYDDNGHGTHCAGIAAGNGRHSNGEYRGVAPEANIIGVKVLDHKGTGTIETIIQGIEWCITYNQNNPNQPIHVISISLGIHATKYQSELDDPIVKIVEEAWRAGITVVTAAGNSGPDPFTISSPGISEQIITVGALDSPFYRGHEEMNTASFSSRGPTIYGKPKPDLLAPGVDLVSLRVPGSSIDRSQKNHRVGKHYTRMSGTSMSTPYCAGVCALLLQSNKLLAPDTIKNLLIEGATTSHLASIGQINIENSLHLLKRKEV